MQEQKHDQHHQHDGFAQRLDHLFDGQADERGRVIGDHIFELHFARVKRLELREPGLDGLPDLKRIGARGQLYAHCGGGLAIKGRVHVVAVTAQLNPRHLTEQHHRARAVGLDQHIAKLFGGLQFAARTDRCIQLLLGHGWQRPELARRHFGVLCLQRGDHIRGHQGVFFEQRRVQPDAHGVARTEGLHLADPVDPGNRVKQGAGDVIANLRAGHAGVVGREGCNHQEV